MPAWCLGVSGKGVISLGSFLKETFASGKKHATQM